MKEEDVQNDRQGRHGKSDRQRDSEGGKKGKTYVIVMGYLLYAYNMLGSHRSREMLQSVAACQSKLPEHSHRSSSSRRNRMWLVLHLRGRVHMMTGLMYFRSPRAREEQSLSIGIYRMGWDGSASGGETDNIICRAANCPRSRSQSHIAAAGEQEEREGRRNALIARPPVDGKQSHCTALT